MQQYALHPDGRRIHVSEAISGVDYICPECRNFVRIKRGEVRQAHFFHKNDNVSCHLRFKHEFHSTVQEWIVKQLGADYCTVEWFFPTITRIADVAYHKKKTVFEIQVSPITAKEALERTYDYYSIGWNVIWILHSATFGHRISSDFEKNIIHIPHYFTDIGFLQGSLYDEASVVLKKYRHWFYFPPYRKQLLQLHVRTSSIPTIETVQKTPIDTMQDLITFRKKYWPCFLEGDLTCGQNNPPEPSANSLLPLLLEKGYIWLLNLFR